MAGLFSRAFTPSHCRLLQLPTPLRHCSSSHASLLARQVESSIGIRLFHASPVSAARKPKSAVVKPVTDQNPRPRPTSPPKKVHLPFQSHPPSAVPQNIPHDAPPPSASSPNPIAHPDTTYPSLKQLKPTQKQTQKPANVLPFTGRPDAPSSSPVVTPYQGFVEKLALSPEPTVIYTSQPQRLYIGVCVASSIFLGAIATTTWNNYQSAIEQNGWPVAVAAMLFSGVWIVCATYFAYGPVGLIKRIVALPAKTGLVRVATQTPKPTLRIEPFALVFGKYPTPFEVELGHVLSDRSFSREIERFARYKAQSGPPGVLAEFFSFVPNAFNAFIKMFARPQRLTYVRVNGRANFKLDLNDCKTLDEGKVLDQLIKVDTKPIHMVEKGVRKMFY